MAKRFTDTEIWDDDWWIELPDPYKFFWFYIKDHCDFVGVISPRMKKFERFTDFSINIDEALSWFNEDKDRIIVLNNGKWLIKDFVSFQYGANIHNKGGVHASVRKKMSEYGITPEMIGINFTK